MYDEDRIEITKEVLSNMKMAKIFKDCVNSFLLSQVERGEFFGFLSGWHISGDLR